MAGLVLSLFLKFALFVLLASQLQLQQVLNQFLCYFKAQFIMISFKHLLHSYINYWQFSYSLGIYSIDLIIPNCLCFSLYLCLILRSHFLLSMKKVLQSPFDFFIILMKIRSLSLILAHFLLSYLNEQLGCCYHILNHFWFWRDSKDSTSFHNMKVHIILKLINILTITTAIISSDLLVIFFTIVVVLVSIIIRSILSFSFRARFSHLFIEFMLIFLILVTRDFLEGFFMPTKQLLSIIFTFFI